MNLPIEKIAPTVVFVLVGSIIMLIGAVGIVPFVAPQIILEPAVRALLVIVGLGLVGVGLFLSFREQTIVMRQSGLLDNNGSGFLSKRVNVRVFDDHYDSQQEMRKVILSSLQKDGETTIRVIGVALHYSWPFLKKIVQDCVLDKTLKGRLVFEFAMLAESWPKENRFRDWSQRIHECLNEMRSFKSHYRSLFDQGHIKLRITNYNQMPSKHGLLIDNGTLFLSHCYIVDKGEDELYDLRVGENRYEVYKLGDKIGGTEQIKQFNQLFQYYEDTGVQIES